MVLFTAVGLAALLPLSAQAGGWWDDASDHTAVYPVAPPVIAGDLDGNGIVEAEDARRTLRFAVGFDMYAPVYGASPDYNGDGAVTAADARLILRCAVGLEGTAMPKADNGAYRIRVGGISGGYGDLGALIPLATNASQATGFTGERRPLWRLRSVDDVEAFIAALRAAGTEPFDQIEAPVFLRRYDEAFFGDRELFVCFTVEGSGANLQAVYSPTVTGEGQEIARYPLPDMSLYPTLARDRTLTFFIDSVYPEGGTCDVADWFLFLPVEKTAAAGCAAFDCISGDGGVLPFEEFHAACNGKTKWMYAFGQILPASTQIRLQAGDETAFALENAQDGGYMWEWETDAAAQDYAALFTGENDSCDFWIKEELVCKPTAACGASGLHLYTVRANKPGVYTLQFSLKRSWETEPIEERTVTLAVLG